MTITLQASDALEYMTDTDYEILGNQGRYGVFSGCSVTYDAANLTLDIAAGTILHNGLIVQVAAQANALTLVADSSNKRWAYVALDSSGTAALVSGDAAADSSTEPTKPELGDNVLLAMVKIEAAQTVADDIAVKLDKRIMLPAITIIKQADETVSGSTTLQNDDELVVYCDASTTYAFHGAITINSGTTPDYKGGFTTPSGATITYGITGLDAAGSTFATTVVNASAGSVAVSGAAANTIVPVFGFITTSTTAGNLQFQFAQNTSDGGNTTTKKGSWLNVMRC